MPELTTSETLQPSLLDRLTDEDPSKEVESRERRVLSLGRLREAVIRDLTWLLNSGNLEPTGMLEGYEHAANSVINYGLRDLTGVTESTVDVSDLERSVRECVRRFEPRILPDTVRVKVVEQEGNLAASGNRLAFEIEGDLWARPLPEHLFLQTEVDLEDGSSRIERASR
ncbi:MAG: type VI secretion system baseplate subunit TssE [Phycisphaerales bacterium JB040]